jgi:hypothetical protein
MALSAFSDKSRPPTDADLRSALGGAHAAWSQLIALVSERVPPITQLWGFTSKSTGWGLRLRHEERVILYMTPCEGHFLVSFALGEKAVARARAAKLPKPLLAAIDAAPRYAEGRGLRLEVRDGELLSSLTTLAEIKRES